MDEEQAQKVCPPSPWPASYVLGLGAHHYPVDWAQHRDRLGWFASKRCRMSVRIEYQFICIDFLYAGPFVTIWDRM